MKNVFILVVETAIPAAIVDPQYMFSAVNKFYMDTEKDAAFNIELIGVKKEVQLNLGSITVKPNTTIEKAKQADLIIIPALSGNMETALELNKEFIPFIQKQYEGGAEIASLCVGAFLLASTGLLNGKQCSTHWLFANQFKEMFPKVELAEDKIITDQNGVYTSGGATSYCPGSQERSPQDGDEDAKQCAVLNRDSVCHPQKAVSDRQ